MALKQYLVDNYNTILHAKQIVETYDNQYISCDTINPIKLDNNTITIVMTTHNRSNQTYYTLKTISESQFKNVQIVLVDDYVHDVLCEIKLKSYNMHIDYIKVKNKFWLNPCINYNIGFQYIKGTKVIIQNSEVCHIGDVLQYVNDNLEDNTYMSFDVLNLGHLKNNTILHKMNYMKYADINKSIFPKHLHNHLSWYQHHSMCNKNYHFLVALTKATFDIVGGFDYDYCVGWAFDDNSLVYNIKMNNIKIIPINNENAKVMGIHQWHLKTPSPLKRRLANEPLYLLKKKYYEKNGVYMNIIMDSIPLNIKARIDELFST